MATVDPVPAPAIVVVGSMNMDLVTYVDRVPGPGETVLGRRFESGFGGKGANQAVMARLLGAEVAFVGALGDDPYAEMTLESFGRLGIETGGVMRVSGSSGLAPIWVERDGTNRIVVISGANELVTAVHAVRAVAATDPIDACVGQFEIPQAATVAAFEGARARGATTILNPAPAARIDLALLAATDWLVPNEVEFGVLAETGGEEPTDAKLAGFATQTRTRVIVTLGARGAALVGADGVVRRVPAPQVEAIDTSGAGDAFVGAFAVGLAMGLPEIDAVRLGIACASDSVLRRGTQASFPDAGGASRSWPGFRSGLNSVRPLPIGRGLMASISQRAEPAVTSGDDCSEDRFGLASATAGLRQSRVHEERDDQPDHPAVVSEWEWGLEERKDPVDREWSVRRMTRRWPSEHPRRVPRRPSSSSHERIGRCRRACRGRSA